MARWDEKRQAWRIVVDVGRPGQKRRRTVRDIHEPNTRVGRRAAELAEAKLRLEAAEATEADWPGQADGTFADAALGWVTRARGKRGPWSPKTVKETKYALRRYILPALGATALAKVTPRHIEDLYAAWAAAGHSPPAMLRWHGMIRTIFTEAERLGDLDRSPMHRVVAAGGAAPERRLPSPDDIRRVIAAAPNPMTAVYFELAATGGARRGTLTALRWHDVDLDTGIVSYVQAVAEGCDGQILKTNKAGRVYAATLTGGGLDALREQRRRALETAFALGVAGRLDDLFVFSSDGGLTPWNVSWPSHAWLAACRRAGVTPCRLHDARHFAATRQLAAGISNRVVADRLGCTEGNLIRTYSHRVPSPDDARAAQVMDELLAR